MIAMTHDPHSDDPPSDQLLKELGLSPDDWIKAQQVIAAHGRLAAQHMVDLIQGALRAEDEATARGYEHVLRMIELHDSYVRAARTTSRTRE
jgi:hypothetical protein